MSLNRYNGICFRCGKNVPAGKGDFQSKNTLHKKIRNKIQGKWLVRCFGCKQGGNKPLETSPFYNLLTPTQSE